ncbi:hypothetical protein MDA_GLEAN10019000 [Myotis davidii]|uniref:Uncharacterized protein n=1 Tax=Myotis davidii TaxID=225400 RepID=L5M3M5_MYODS|nr:hypothetical protein MDA_GLEAN10019000 [Myotis davidii]
MVVGQIDVLLGSPHGFTDLHRSPVCASYPLTLRANVPQNAVTHACLQQSQTTARACSPRPSAALPSTPACLHPRHNVHISPLAHSRPLECVWVLGTGSCEMSVRGRSGDAQGGQCSDKITFMGLMQVLRQEQVQTDTPGGRGAALIEVPPVSVRGQEPRGCEEVCPLSEMAVGSEQLQRRNVHSGHWRP